MIARSHGNGRVVYLAAGIDHALWSYAYPYQRVLLGQAIRWAAGGNPPIQVSAPLCIQTTFFEQSAGDRKRLVVHFFNDLNTSANHGAPTSEVPLREETVPVGGIEVRLARAAWTKFCIEPGNRSLKAVWNDGQATIVIPPVDRHLLLIGERH
jgi:hypothetical protein